MGSAFPRCMAMTPLAIPENARCRKCGYALRGLTAFRCPECGRAFDPANARSFDTSPPGWRRKRWIKRAVVTAGLIAALFAVFPRGIMESSITFTCADCRNVQRVRRWEPRPPNWIPFRYPGLTWRDTQDGRSPHTPGFHRNYRADLKSDLHCRGRVTAWGDSTFADPCSFNGILVTPVSAPTFLYEMLSPANNGIGP